MLRVERPLMFVVTHDRVGQRWRAELWQRPFTGWLVASTRWVSTKTWAVRDGRRAFRNFIKFHD